MARRKGRKGHGKSKAIPVLPVICALQPAIQTATAAGKVWYPGAQNDYLFNYTGYNTATGKMHWQKTMGVLGLQIVGLVGHKVANKTVNKYVKKLTFGYVVL